MRIAYLVPTSDFSGAENMTLLIAKELSARHDVWYCSPEGAICDYTKKSSIPHLPVPNMSAKTVKYIQKTIAPDLFHACDNRASLACALAGVPYVSHLHSNPLWLKKLNAYSCAMLFSCLRSKQTIGVSDSVFDEFLFSRFIRHKCVTLLNVVDLSHVSALAQEDSGDETYDLSYIGRMSQEKNPMAFVHVVAKIAEQFPRISAVMIGGGDMLPDVQSLARQKGLGDNITFTGFLHNPYSVLQKSRVVIMPSTYEGFGLTAIEAMCLGKPVLASPVGGLKRIVDSSCGEICNNETEFAELAMKLLANDEIYSKKSQGAKSRAQEFGDVAKYAAEIEKIYSVNSVNFVKG